MPPIRKSDFAIIASLGGVRDPAVWNGFLECRDAILRDMRVLDSKLFQSRESSQLSKAVVRDVVDSVATTADPQRFQFFQATDFLQPLVGKSIELKR